MSLWGKKDSVYRTGTVSVNYGTLKVTKFAGSINFSSGGVAAGDIITVGAGASLGEAIITAVDDAETLSIASTAHLATGVATVTCSDYNISQKPKSTLLDTNYQGNEIFGVDVDEQQAVRGDNSQYRPASSGWVGITSYTDNHGNQRVKTEVLVAGGGDGFITGDADDDTILPDS